MNLLAPISTIMTKDVLTTLHPKDPLTQVARIFSEKKIHHIPVVQYDKLIGMVSKTDFLHFELGYAKGTLTEEWNQARLEQHNVEDIMTTKLGKLEPTDRINVALEVFKTNRFHALPVVQDDRLVGILTTYDIICHLADDPSVTKEY